MNNKTHVERCRPAHHPPIERFHEPVIVLVTVCTQDRRPVLACEEGHQLCRNVWQAADNWRVGRYVVMPDHIHLFCSPGRIPMPSLRQWVEFWKSRIAVQWPKGIMDATEVVPLQGGNAEWICEGPASVRAEIGIESPDGTEAVPPRTVGQGAFKLWQRDFWDTQMRSRTHYDEKWSYGG